MSTYQMVVSSVYRGLDLRQIRENFWRWWTSLYAEAPRRLPPML